MGQTIFAAVARFSDGQKEIVDCDIRKFDPSWGSYRTQIYKESHPKCSITLETIKIPKGGIKGVVKNKN